jgi:hypothetical protein
VGAAFGDWVSNPENQSKWWSKGNWTQYDNICRWHAYQGINSLLPRGSMDKPESEEPKASETEAPEAEGSAGRGVYDPVRGWI